MATTSAGMMERLKQFTGLSSPDSRRRTIFLEELGEVGHHFEEISITKDDLLEVTEEMEPDCTRCKQMEFHQRLRDKEVMLQQYKMKLDQVLIEIHNERVALEQEWNTLYRHKQQQLGKSHSSLENRQQPRRFAIDTSGENVIDNTFELRSESVQPVVKATQEEEDSTRLSSYVTSKRKSKEQSLKNIASVVQGVIRLQRTQPKVIAEPVPEPKPQQSRRTTIRMLSERSFEGVGAERKQARRKSTIRANNLLRETLKVQMFRGTNKAEQRTVPVLVETPIKESDPSPPTITTGSSNPTAKRFSISNPRAVPSLDLPQNYVSEFQNLIDDPENHPTLEKSHNKSPGRRMFRPHVSLFSKKIKN